MLTPGFGRLTGLDQGSGRRPDGHLDQRGGRDDRRYLGGVGRWVLVAVTLLVAFVHANAAEWQWSVPDGEARAYLWIPPDCARVRGVVVANHNMIEQGILEHATMRRTLAELGFAEIWVVPYLDATFDFNQGAGEHFDRVVAALAAASGYEELRVAPVVPLGHSACATFPWNFAAWKPARTLAILSVKGDAPRTTLTGNGKPRIAWDESRSIDGIPGLMVMGEFEWWEDRLTPAFAFQAEHPAAPIAMLADAGHGHFDYSDELVGFLALFIRKAAAARLPAQLPAALDAPVPLKPVDPREGWRIDRWRRDEPLKAPAAPYAAYAGDPREAFWCFDEEMARAMEAHYARARGKKPQLLSVTDLDAADPQSGCGEPVTPRFLPREDGVSFRLRTAFVDRVPGREQPKDPSKRFSLPSGMPLEHAEGGGPIRLSWIVGPAAQIGPDLFQVRFGRAEHTANRRNHDVWVLGWHPGDAQMKSAVQQAMVRLKPNTEGAEQRIEFPDIPNQPAGEETLRLPATSSAGLPVSYYVVEGPAEVEGGTLRFTTIPPRTTFPVKVTVVAWQWGRAAEPKVKTAERVERTFWIQK